MVGGILSRRALLAGPAMAAGSARAQDAPPPLTIGVLTDPTGLGAAVSGAPLEHAVRMALLDPGAMPDGRPVSLVAEQFRLRPDDAVAIARRWFDSGVSAVVDVPGSAAAAAVQALARSRGRSTLVTGSVNPDLTGAACSPYGSCWSVDSASMTTALVRTMAKAGVRTWFLVVPDTVLGLAVQGDAIRAIEAAGGQVAGRSRHPPDMTDYASVVQQVNASGAAAVGLCDINDALAGQLGQFQAGGLFRSDRRVVAFLPSVTAVHAAGPAAAQGLLLAAPFYWNQNEQARSFAARFLADTGQVPDAAHAGAYVAVRHYLRAVAATGSTDAGQVNREMRRTPVYFFGRTGRLRLDGRLSIDLALMRVKPPGAMQGDWDHYEAIGAVPAAEAYPPLAQSGCPVAI